MSVFVISYDLHKIKDYQRLFDSIKQAAKFGWCRAVESTWFISTDSNSVAIREYINRSINSDASLLVCKLDHGDGAWVGLAPEVSAWLKSNLS
jgi:hypothetical protein